MNVHLNRIVGSLSVLAGTSFEENDTEVVTLTVVTKEEKPYVMLREGRHGNEAFDGFAIDLLKVSPPSMDGRRRRRRVKLMPGRQAW